jgi:hypothetical protein
VGETAFREVSKKEFKEIYSRLGGGPSSGWTADYWHEFFEVAVNPDWKFMAQEPRDSEHDQMWIVSDTAAKEYRLFFLTEESTESFFDFPGKE